MHTDQRGHEQELGREVTVGHRVDRVGERRVEAQLQRHPLRIQWERGPGQCPRSQAAHRGAAIPVPQPVDVTDERMDVGQ